MFRAREEVKEKEKNKQNIEPQKIVSAFQKQNKVRLEGKKLRK